MYESIEYGTSLLKFVSRMPDSIMGKDEKLTLSWEMKNGLFLCVVFEVGELPYWYTSDFPNETNYIGVDDMIDLINSLLEV